MHDTEGKTTLVCFHDLLGYGNMVSVSGGTLDSAIGKIARQRINMLRKTMHEIKNEFPEGTAFFQMNDSAVAVYDIDINFNLGHIDSGNYGIDNLFNEKAIFLLKFICGSAMLHDQMRLKEEKEKTGPAGRTFVVLGKRWDTDTYEDDKITDVPMLQANLAFAEAYKADMEGTKAGFNQLASRNIYINELIYLALMGMNRPLSSHIPPEVRTKFSIPGIASLNHHSLGSFPHYILTRDVKPVELPIFHRNRKFYSIMSHHAVKINELLATLPSLN